MSTDKLREREWDYCPVPDGEEFVDRDGNTVVGWHHREDGQDVEQLRGEFEAYGDDGFDYGPLFLRPVLVRTSSDIECKIRGWEEGTFIRCTSRAKHPTPMWQIELAQGEERHG